MRKKNFAEKKRAKLILHFFLSILINHFDENEKGKEKNELINKFGKSSGLNYWTPFIF